MAAGFDRDCLVALLKRDALRLGRFTLASGRESHYYVDGRRVTLSAEGAALIGQGVLDVLADLPGVSALGGLTMGADPIVGAALAVAAARGRPGLRGFLVRKEAKGPGGSSKARWRRGISWSSSMTWRPPAARR
jgi:orotate phosphoribosyltransferase